MSGGRPAPARVVAAGSLALTAAVVPAFLTGALSGRMGDDLGFGGGGAGAAVAAFFVGSGALAVPMARVTERLGSALALRAGVAWSAACGLAVATVVDGLWSLCAVLALGGAAVGLVDTGAARAFDDAVPDGRQGVAFGAKEASVPAASLVAGVSVPVLADGAGWRVAFLLGAALAPLVWAVVPRLTGAADDAGTGVDDVGGARGDRGAVPGAGGGGPAGGDAGAPGDEAGAPVDEAGAPVHAGRAPAQGVGDDGRGGVGVPRALVLFAAGAGVACGAATAAGTLLVPAVEDRGWSEGAAGWLLAGASLASITVRVVAGVRTDERPDGSWRQLLVLLAVGAAGAVLLAATSGSVTGVLGSVAVIGGGWGWTGLAYATAVRVGGPRPAAAAGVVLTGLSVGGAGGPAAFAAVADAASYPAAWSVVAVALLAGAAAILAAQRSLEPAASVVVR